MQIIKDRAVIQNRWQHLADEEIPEDGCITVSIGRWTAEKNELISRNGEIGLRISADDSIEDIADDLTHFQLIGLDFPTFTDGRLFSVARLLRGRYRYQGEIRALGHFIRDQIFFLSRVGVNAFEMDETTDLSEALSALNDFSVKYQKSSDNSPC